MSEVKGAFDKAASGDGDSVTMTRVVFPAKNELDMRFVLGVIADKFGAIYDDTYKAKDGVDAVAYLVPPQNEGFLRKDVEGLLAIINRKHSPVIRPPKGMDLEDMD